MGVRAQGAVIDKNEAEHVGPPPGTGSLVETQRDFHRHLLLGRFAPQNSYSRNRHLVIAPQVLLIAETHEKRATRDLSRRPTRNLTA
jgi:hypothetical protein